MKFKNILLILIVIAVIVTIFYSFNSDSGNTAYRDELRKDRDEKDQFMRTSAESPFADDFSKFTGLKYYDANMQFRIVASLTPIEAKKAVMLPTSDGKDQSYVEYAYAEFDMGGHHNKLLILEGIDIGPVRGKLFLAFGDETSARETYGAGRYLDVAKVPGAKTVELDFNKAYNPFCAYSGKFSCPFPPKENLLPIAVKAGEKIYDEDH